jgi:hypothetical protein
MQSNPEYQLYDTVFWGRISGSIMEIRSTETGTEYLVHFEGPCETVWCKIEAAEHGDRLQCQPIFC